MSRRTTIGELADWWLHNVQRHQVCASTWSKAEDRIRRIIDTLGTIEVGKLQVEHVVTWQSRLLTELAPKTVGHHRQTLAQVMDQAVELGLAAANPVRRVKAPRVPRTTAQALTVNEARTLVAAASEGRYGAAVALHFFQGWRVSEALGLAWSDLDLDAGIAVVRRACIYVDHQGAALGPTKTAGAMGDHQLVPTVVDLLRRRGKVQAAEALGRGGGRPDRPTAEAPSGTASSGRRSTGLAVCRPRPRRGAEFVDPVDEVFVRECAQVTTPSAMASMRSSTTL